MSTKANNLLITNFYNLGDPSSACFLKIFSNDVKAVKLNYKLSRFDLVCNHFFDVKAKNYRLYDRLTNLQQSFIGTPLSMKNLGALYEVPLKPLAKQVGKKEVAKHIPEPIREVSTKTLLRKSFKKRKTSFYLLAKVSKDKKQKQLTKLAKPRSTSLLWQIKNKKKAYKIVRPMLSCSRAELTSLCHAWRLPVYPDQSNDFTEYSRNRIRKQLLPAIRLFFNPKVENVIFQFTEIIADEQFFITKTVDHLLTVLFFSDLSKLKYPPHPPSSPPF
uniref:hypothetical chloroplast RF62 n=1 Tax=Watanabea sichuanensis TaxID=2704660 RepID=UPI002410F49F|nr:hypothetical chloroplast RF62 [Watanabea sichuanensis]WDY13196.1 hypothetical chloroplast RF62 [Watanabea sichuanensis]